MRIRTKITWRAIEEWLGWEKDSISGVPLETFSYSELVSIKYALINLISDKYEISIGRLTVL